MDNYDLSNLPLLSHCADFGEHHPWLTYEQNRRATFSKRSATVSKSEQVERQQLRSIGDEQIPRQRALANFDISLASATSATMTITDDEPEDPFAALAAYHYQLFTFNDDPRQPLNSNLGLVGDINTSSEAVLAELEGNDVVDQPEQSQGESDTKGISIPESAISDTVSGKRLASKPESSIEKSVDPHFQESSRRFDQLTIKRRKQLDGTEIEFLPLPRGKATRSQYAATLVKSTAPQKNTEQSPDQSLRDRIKKESEQWIVRLEQDAERQHMCAYPNCGLTFKKISNLKSHIFIHIGISTHQCSYPECSDAPYFRTSSALRRHELLYHKKEKPYHCTLCNKRFKRSDNYKRHMRNVHKMSL